MQGPKKGHSYFKKDIFLINFKVQVKQLLPWFNPLKQVRIETQLRNIVDGMVTIRNRFDHAWFREMRHATISEVKEKNI